MRLFLLTFLTMLAFAGNSLLTRAALASPAIDAGDFASIRLGAGALMLCVIIAFQKQRLPTPNAQSWKMSAALLLYMLGFSYAYLQLDTGIGALILFGFVQLTMLGGVLLAGGKLQPLQILGGMIAFGGLVLLFLPSDIQLPLGSGFLMIAAAIGWGIYSLLGKTVDAPLPATALNFLLATPICLFVAILIPNEINMSLQGMVLAALSGAITSGLGYALWYAVLPHLNTAVAATAQLSVPIWAMIMGAVFLGEELSTRAIISAFIVILGIAISIWASYSRGRSGERLTN